MRSIAALAALLLASVALADLPSPPHTAAGVQGAEANGAAAASSPATGPVQMGGVDDAGVIRKARLSAAGATDTTAGAYTNCTLTEVLVLTSATNTPASPLAGRRRVMVQNLGPNAIFCNPGGTATLNKAWRLDVEAATVDAKIEFFIPSSVNLSCIAATANQVTGAATIVVECK
jgi:hypothetical protein